MPISGLVVSLTNQHDLRENAINAIREESRIEVGVVDGQRIPIVVDTSSAEEDKAIWNWLTTLPGVTFVDVVMISIDEPSTAQLPEAECVGNPRFHNHSKRPSIHGR